MADPVSVLRSFTRLHFWYTCVAAQQCITGSTTEALVSQLLFSLNFSVFRATNTRHDVLEDGARMMSAFPSRRAVSLRRVSIGYRLIRNASTARGRTPNPIHEFKAAALERGHEKSTFPNEHFQMILFLAHWRKCLNVNVRSYRSLSLQLSVRQLGLFVVVVFTRALLQLQRKLFAAGKKSVMQDGRLHISTSCIFKTVCCISEHFEKSFPSCNYDFDIDVSVI